MTFFCLVIAEIFTFEVYARSRTISTQRTIAPTINNQVKTS